MASSLLIYPRLVSQGDALSGDLTKVKFNPVTPELIESQGMTEWKTQFLAQVTEARVVGVVPNTLAEILLSRIEPIGKGEKLQEYRAGTTFISAPFKYRRRERNMKVGWFNVSAGAANANAGTTSGGVVYPASAFDITVNIGTSPWATGYKNLARFFREGHFIYIEHFNQETGVAYNSAHQILKAVDSDEDNAIVTVYAPYSNAQWAALTAAQKLPYQPTFGAVSLGANNVSDYESFGANPPSDLSEELLVDWFQTMRTFRGETDEYLSGLSSILDGKVNEYLSNFRELEMTKRNKQMMTLEELEFLNTIWFNTRISPAQKKNPELADIQALPTAKDPEDGTEYERKSNLLGIHTQLVEEGRRIDLQGAPLNLDLILEESHNIRRHRKLDGRPWDTIVWMCDRWVKDDCDQLFNRYLQDLYGFNCTRYIEQGKVMVDGTNIVAMEYTAYDIPVQHLRIAFFAHDYFEDRLLAFTDGTNGTVNARARGKMMVCVDFNDIKIAIAEMNSVKREYKGETTANANSTWSRVMKLNTKHFEMRSKKLALEFGDFNRHSIVENFSDVCPVLTARVRRPVS